MPMTERLFVSPLELSADDVVDDGVFWSGSSEWLLYSISILGIIVVNNSIIIGIQ